LTDPGNYGNRLHIRKDKTNPRRLAYLTLLLFASPPHWSWLAAGIASVATGIALHGWAAGYIARAGYAEREKTLTVGGPYRHVRNPYYLAQMIMDLGVFILAGHPFFYLFYFPVIFFVYRRWVVREESFLENEIGKPYLALKRDVPRWWFRINPAPGLGSALSFQWATFRLNREPARSLSHLCFLVVFVLFFFFGNPFNQISILLRATVIATIAVWFILREIYPLNASHKSVGWSIVAACSALMTAIFLIYAPVWQPWFGTSAWITIGVGICFGLLVWFSALPGVAGVSGSIRNKFFARPICQWYLLALGLGLLSCRLAGVWLGTMVPFTAWALQIAGWVSIQMVPQRFNVSLGILTLIACLAGFAVAKQLS
jgi:hypothetical protein